MNNPYDCKFYYEVRKIGEYLDCNPDVFNKFINENRDFKDFHPLVAAYYFAEHNVEEIINKCFYTICFSEYCNREIMRAHYADNGKGFALEYDEDEIKTLLLEKRKK